MRQEMTETYTLAKDYVLRTHNLSTNEVSRLNVNSIKELCASPIVSEAIFLASPELHQEMTKYLKGKTMKNEDKLVQSLLKYLLRMGHRCTPFGLFSGCSLGKIAETTNIELDASTEHKRFTRIDMSYICSLVQQLEKTHEIRKELKYYPNTSLYPVGNKLRYIEYRYKGTNRRHYTVSIDNSKYIDLILKKATKGANIEELAQFIVEPDISIDDAKTFINQLIDNQILISSISPSVTGENYLQILMDKIPDENTKNRLHTIDELLKKLDSNTYENNFTYYKQLTDILDSFEIAYNKKFLFQTDLTISTQQNTLSDKIVKDIHKGVEILNKLVPYQEDEKLTKFRRKFFDMFEEEQVPLSLALDVETGVGYGFNSEEDYDISPLINDLNLSTSNRIADHKKIKWTKTDSFLNKKLMELEKDAIEMLITDNDLDSFTENWNNLPLSFTAIIHLLNNDNDNPLINMSYVGGASATYMLGRFTQADKNIEQFLKKITQKESEERDVVFAEIAHLPEKRTGNIINRSHLRTHEIPYLTKSTLPSEQQIAIDDIWVSVEQDRIVLFSKKLNKEVIPRMATAHNFSYNSLPIYHFLCDIQTQHLRDNLVFEWRNAAINRDFLPRIRYKNIIISLAQWRIGKKEIQKIIQLNDLTEWRKEKKLPQKIMLSDDDNELVIDLEHPLSVKAFLSTIKNRQQITLVEYLFDEKNALVTRQGKAFCNELFFSFVKQNKI
ncbi:lantibiotic dehydratase family protein [Aquimarina spongiae]|uniref:Lantibiotic dehydratase, C terminus n=1 Tax=Aquimarina spongiae TaxID=570521 RepID=A0A1M6IF63_9FLAO|nr:lantibiotic dehydratase family protein [Aquimarina spongiae]SHJ33081.1 Lantibiotic dehydratase, C terminus [Aquimarina spongiae]